MAPLDDPTRFRQERDEPDLDRVEDDLRAIRRDLARLNEARSRRSRTTTSPPPHHRVAAPVLNAARVARRRASFQRYRPSVRANEEQSLRELWALLQKAQSWEERIDAGGPEAAQVQSSSALAADDVLTAPYQLSHSAWHALVVAVDHTRCLRWALNGEERRGQINYRLGTYSPGTILRCAIENGARAVWLLKPDARPKRVARRFALEIYEYSQAKNLWDQLGRTPKGASQAAHRNQLRRLKRAAHLPKADPEANFPGYGGLVRQAGGDGAIAAWRACSSLAHGATRGVNLLTSETVSVAAGVETRYVTGLSIRLLTQLTGLAVGIIDHGFTRYQQLAQAGTGPAVALAEDDVTLVVQVARKVRARLRVPAGLVEAAAIERALASEAVQRALGGAGVRPRRVVYLPDKLINLVP